MIVVSYSELDTFRQCPLKHELAYKQRWTKEKLPGSPLARGTLWHKVMEIHYDVLKQNPHKRGLFVTKMVVWDYLNSQIEGPTKADPKKPQPPQKDDDLSLIWWMYLGYLGQWSNDPDWEILEIEAAFELPLAPATASRPEIRLKGKIDLLVRDRTTKKIWVVDHKSGAELPNQVELDIDDQFGLYLCAARELWDNVSGCIHSASRTRTLKGDLDGTKPQPLEQRFRRTLMSRTGNELANLWADARRTAEAAYDRVGPPYSAPDPRQCRWKCDFLEPHLLMRKGVPAKTALTSFNLVQDFTRH